MPTPADWIGYAIVIRHGVTVWDRAPRVEPGMSKIYGSKKPNEGIIERVTGWLDLPLRPEGLREVLHTSDALKQYPVDGIATSTLDRALVTAKAVAQLHPQARFVKAPELRAWNTGLYSGQKVTQVQAQLDAAVRAWDTPIPMGETFHQFVRRFLPFGLHLVNDPARLWAIVTHGMNIEVLIKYQQTGDTRFEDYSGMTGQVQPAEAVLITPQGVEELAA